MDEHEALVERMAQEIAEGRLPPPTTEEIEQHALELPTDRDLTIGEAATMFGILPTTIRYYEDEGLLRVGRRENGHRVFDRAAPWTAGSPCWTRPTCTRTAATRSS